MFGNKCNHIHDKQRGMESGQGPMSFTWLSNNIKGKDLKHPKQC